jgi:Cyclic-phosphate processing Receiver domain
MARCATLKEVAGDFEHDEQALLRALELLNASRLGRYAAQQAYAARRRDEKQRGHRTPRSGDTDPGQRKQWSWPAPGLDASETTIVLVDDLRSFADARNAEVARTSAAGVLLLYRYRDRRLDELWLDHDLGESDTIWPVVEGLERAAFEGRPFDIGVINVHSANPAGAAKIAQVLRHWGYRVNVASGSAEVGYLTGPPVRGKMSALGLGIRGQGRSGPVRGSGQWSIREAGQTSHVTGILPRDDRLDRVEGLRAGTRRCPRRLGEAP